MTHTKHTHNENRRGQKYTNMDPVYTYTKHTYKKTKAAQTIPKDGELFKSHNSLECAIFRGGPVLAGRAGALFAWSQALCGVQGIVGRRVA